MADGETLKLPKPLLGNEIRADFLTFLPDRRWDLLGFIKSEEVEEIKMCEVGPDGHRYYLVHWKESWKPESSLMYCEKLLQDFWSKRSMLQQNEVMAPSHHLTTPDKVDICDRTSSLDENRLPESNENEEEMNNIASGDEVIDEVTTTVVIPSEDVQNTVEEASNKVAQTTSYNVEDTTDKDVNFILVVDSSPSEPFDIPSEIAGQEIDAHIEPSDNKNDNLTQISENGDVDGDISTDYPLDVQAGHTKVIHENLVAKKVLLPINVNSYNDVESPSKKGAPKRKARPPRQSMHSLGTKSCIAKKKEKIKKAKQKIKRIKEKAKAPKISKTGAMNINSGSIPQSGNGKHTNGDDDSDITAFRLSTNNLKCMVCDKHLSTEQNLMKHLLTHNNNHTCPVCQKTFKSTHFLKHHMDIHNASYQYSCTVCLKKFKFKNNMRGHIRKHNMEKKFGCEVCRKKFIGRYNLKEHMKSHSDLRPYSCDFCTKAYKDRGALNKHLLTHQEKKVECEICKRPFTNVKQVKRHMQFHYSWPGDSFKRKGNVGPDGEKVKYKCQHCDKTFNHYSNMNAHVHKKHKEKKIQCSSCPKTFAYQYELREHMFIHLGGKGSKFKCQFCDKSFQRSTTLKNHERTTHLGIKRFKCETCGKMFGTKFNMKVHVEKLHINNVNEDIKPRRTRVNRNDRMLPSESEFTTPFSAAEVHPGLAPIAVSLAAVHQHPLLRNISTSDIIRNAMSHIPELSYFPSMPGNPPRYQFYGMTQTDFNVPEPTLS